MIINIKEDKTIQLYLKKFFGIGFSQSGKICDKLNILRNKKVNKLTEDELQSINKYLDRLIIEEKLKRQITNNIKRLKFINSIRANQ